MSFYELSKEKRKLLVEKINAGILSAISKDQTGYISEIFSDKDTYIRKAGYLAIGRIYKKHDPEQPKILNLLDRLFKSEDKKIRQTTINAAGEIGITDFLKVEHLLEKGLFDNHHSVRNAVIGSVKKTGEKNPRPVLAFARRFLHHENMEVRREICHGIELRGRTHPQDILPLLKELQFDKTARVRNTLIHVLGQISYKKGCLQTVVAHLKTWNNEQVVEKAIAEIIDVHQRYKNFAALTQAEAKEYIETNFYS